MPSWRSAAAILCRFGSLALVVVMVAQVVRVNRADFRHDTTGALGFALTLLAIVAGIVVLQVAGVALELAQERVDRTPPGSFGSSARPWTPDRIMLGAGAILLLAVGLPTLTRVSERIPVQAVASCTTGFWPRWYIHVVLEHGAQVSLASALEPEDGCVPPGTSFEKRRWEEGYRIGGTFHPVKTRLRRWDRVMIAIGGVLAIAGTAGWARGRAARRRAG